MAQTREQINQSHWGRGGRILSYAAVAGFLTVGTAYELGGKTSEPQARIERVADMGDPAIRAEQRFLQRLGYLPAGKKHVDGILGEETRSARAAYHRDHDAVRVRASDTDFDSDGDAFDTAERALNDVVTVAKGVNDFKHGLLGDALDLLSDSRGHSKHRGHRK
jgi:hypothetical protein